LVAGLLNWPQATFVGNAVVENGKLIANREIDGRLKTVTMNLPAVVSVDLPLNESRYIALPNIMKVKKKTLADLGVDIKHQTQASEVSYYLM
jgi:electron transfer flavoprotein beta subunit